jgi:hypothetical protein
MILQRVAMGGVQLPMRMQLSSSDPGMLVLPAPAASVLLLGHTTHFRFR